MPQHITVKKYNPNWTRQFIAEKEIVASILTSNAFEIYHIGSTAVRGLRAKPIIDIMPIVYSISAVDLVSSDFEKNGYEYLGEYGIRGRRYLRKGGDERTHQIHIYQLQDKHNIERHLAVRDYLRANFDIAQEYGKLKTGLAARFPYDIEGYCNGKDKFMQQLEKSAIEWYENTIRKAYVTDFDKIMHIWKEENIRAHNFISQNYWLSNFNSVKDALFQAEIFVYVCNGEIVGFIGLNDNYIEGVFVKSNQQRNGVGRALLDKAKELKSALTLSVYTKNVKAISFYLKHGFKIVDEKVDENTDENEYTMQWLKDD